MTKRRAILIILDGWGIAPPNRGNAISMANTPMFDQLISRYPTVAVQAAGEAVGLPWGEMGNSEVGHLNIGAGRILYQDLPRITKAITDESFYSNPAFVEAIEHTRQHDSTVHIAGLVSNGGIHSFHEHIYALIALCKQQKVSKVFVHAFLDGRDTPYNSAKNFIVKLEHELQEAQTGAIATIAGRYWAMDRDNRWERTERAYRAMVEGKASTMAISSTDAIDQWYAKKVYDEQIEPTVITDEQDAPLATIKENDALIFFNFRNDRMRQLTRAFVDTDFKHFQRTMVPNLKVVTMTEYEDGLPVAVAFPPEKVKTPLSRILSDHGLHQLHIAETEKYAHVTFFLNGGREDPFPQEDRVLIPSPTSVATYDQKPEMSARKIADRIVEEAKRGTYEFIVANFANADMVGHTGAMPPIVQAVEFLDQCLGRIAEAALKNNYVMLITADHGNAEEAMNLQTGEIEKEHTSNPVPLVIIDKRLEGHSTVVNSDMTHLTPVGFLSDVAPTVLDLMGIPQPSEMTGRSLAPPTPTA